MPDASSSADTRFWRLVAVVLLALAVCGFGLVTLCGGVFTVAAQQIAGPYAGGFWVISVPSLLIGAWLCWLCARQLRRVWRQLDSGEEEV
jgi:hypothetical protein